MVEEVEDVIVIEIVGLLGLTGMAHQPGHPTGSSLKTFHHASVGRISRIICVKLEKLHLLMLTNIVVMKVLWSLLPVQI